MSGTSIAVFRPLLASEVSATTPQVVAAAELLWASPQQAGHANGLELSAGASAWCEDLSWATRSDWRLPSSSEYGAAQGDGLDPSALHGGTRGSFWTSSGQRWQLDGSVQDDDGNTGGYPCVQALP